MGNDGNTVLPVPPRPSLWRRTVAGFRLDQVAAVFGIVGAIAAVVALWPIFFPPPALPPTIPDFTTGPIDGESKTTKDYCDPRRDALQKHYPDYKIEVTYLPEQHEDNRDSLGIKHDKYTYSCSFAAHKK